MTKKSTLGIARFAIVILLGFATRPSHADTDDQAITEANEGWEIVFDGNNTDALRDFRTDEFPKQGWSIQEDGSLYSEDGARDIVTRKQYRDFDLRLEWKLAKGANSGVLYRVAQQGHYPHDTGPEYQIIDDPRIHKSSTGSLYGLIKPNDKAKINPAGEWNSTRIIVQDNTIQHYLNGELVVEYTWGSDDIKTRLRHSKFREWKGYMQQEAGFIGFQSHGKELWLRNIKVKDLSQEVDPKAVGEDVLS